MVVASMGKSNFCGRVWPCNMCDLRARHLGAGNRCTGCTARRNSQSTWLCALAVREGCGVQRHVATRWTLRTVVVFMLLCRGWGGAMAAAAAAESWEGPGKSPVHRSSRHTSSRRAPSVPRDAYGDDDEDETWADRLWQDMQNHKHQAAMAAAAAAAGRAASSGLFSAGSSRAEAARERERKAAAAAAESARILKEEQAKDADWRAAMMRQVEEVRRHQQCLAHSIMLCVGLL